MARRNACQMKQLLQTPLPIPDTRLWLPFPTPEKMVWAWALYRFQFSDNCFRQRAINGSSCLSCKEEQFPIYHVIPSQRDCVAYPQPRETQKQNQRTKSLRVRTASLASPAAV
jgi:hypothetical protein